VSNVYDMNGQPVHPADEDEAPFVHIDDPHDPVVIRVVLPDPPPSNTGSVVAGLLLCALIGFVAALWAITLMTM